MNLLDITIITVMIFFIVRGIFRGFFREIGSLGGIIAGIWLANLYQPQMTDYLKAYLPSGKWLPLISFAIILVIVLILCNFAGWGLHLLLKKMFLGWTDRILGACFAILKGVIIIYLIIVLLTIFLPSKTPLIAGSRLAPIIITSYQSIISLISPGFYQNWKDKFIEKKKEINKAVSEKRDGLPQKNGNR